MTEAEQEAIAQAKRSAPQRSLKESDLEKVIAMRMADITSKILADHRRQLEALDLIITKANMRAMKFEEFLRDRSRTGATANEIQAFLAT